MGRGLKGLRTGQLVLAYVHGQRLRFDYRVAQLQSHGNERLAEFSDDAPILSVAAFARWTRGPQARLHGTNEIGGNGTVAGVRRDLGHQVPLALRYPLPIIAQLDMGEVALRQALG